MSRAHPRVGGENAVRIASLVPVWGSSPRGRGKRDVVPPGGVHEGLIPAWSGKTECVPVVLDLQGAHPRVGGENWKRSIPNRLLPGSSPRGRGKQNFWSTVLQPLGLIPAWAGKTGESQKGKGRTRAHPRVGGENIATEVFGGIVSGSSPRGRGKPTLYDAPYQPAGLIPAWAGKTSTSSACT